MSQTITSMESSPGICRCAEAKVNGTWNHLPAHDCAYIAARNRLIEPAMAKADTMFDREDDRWTREFFQQVDLLYRESLK